MSDASADPVVLPPARMQPLAVGTDLTLWAFVAPEPLETVLRPAFLGAHAGALQPGDQIMFRSGTGRDVVSGTLVVVEVREAAGDQPARVHTALIASTLAANAPAAVAARARAAA